MNNASISQTMARVMCYNGISLDDIIEALKKIPPEEKFDLAVRTKEDRIIRLPVSDTNIKLDVIGVYPFKNEERYLEKEETEVVTMKDKFKDEVPTLDDFRSLIPVVIPLNKLMERIGGKPIAGEYHTSMAFGEIRRCYPYYIINMSQKTGNVNASFEHGELKAKIRRFIKP